MLVAEKRRNYTILKTKNKYKKAGMCTGRLTLPCYMCSINVSAMLDGVAHHQLLHGPQVRFAAESAQDPVVFWIPGPECADDDCLDRDPLVAPGQVLLDAGVLVLFGTARFLQCCSAVVEGAGDVDDDGLFPASKHQVRS